MKINHEIKFEIRRMVLVFIILIGILLFINNNINKKYNIRYEDVYITPSCPTLYNVWEQNKTGYEYPEFLHNIDIDNPDLGEYVYYGDTITIRIKEVK